MSVVTEIITTDQIHELWGSGFTVVERLRDRFEIPAHFIPPGRSYQWNDVPNGPGWISVPHSRHPGWFGPYGMTGDIVVGGLYLCEKPAEDVKRARADQVKAAHKPLEDWAERNRMFTGGARIVEQYDNETLVSTIMPSEKVVFKTEILDNVETIERPKERTIEVVSKVPPDMMPHMSAVFRERDRLKDLVVRPDRSLDPDSVITQQFYKATDEDKSLPWWPTLHAIILPYAIDNVRKALKETDHE